MLYSKLRRRISLEYLSKYDEGMNETLYCFKYDGKVEYLTITQAINLEHPAVMKRIDEIFLNKRNKRMTKDGFEPGWQENIQAYAGGRLEYDKMLRERGLVEVGFDTEHVKDSTTTGGACRSEEFIKSALDMGVDLTGNEIEAIKSGEYFDDSKCDLSTEEP